MASSTGSTFACRATTKRCFSTYESRGRTALIYLRPSYSAKAEYPVRRAFRFHHWHSGIAHDPPKCERFGDKIMRPIIFGARSDAKPDSTFADRALSPAFRG